MAKKKTILGSALGFCGEVAAKIVVKPIATGICGGNDYAGSVVSRAVGQVAKSAGEFVGDTVSEGVKAVVITPYMIYGGIKECIKSNNSGTK